MKTETVYNSFDLKRGKCTCCGQRTKIVINDGRCPDCIEEQKFYDETMKDSINESLIKKWSI